METTDPELSQPITIRRHLIGNKGQLIQASPCGRYEIRRAVMANFPVEAIVNATNRLMTMNTATVAEDIMTGAGQGLRRWMNDKFADHPEGLEVGEAIASHGFDLLNCYHIIHTNGPSYRLLKQEPIAWLKQRLADCYRRCLEEAVKVGAKELAFPCISTGASLGWPKEEAAKIAITTVRSWFNHPLYGKGRSEKIAGPIYFLTDPMVLHYHQEDAWLQAFSGIWPEIKAPPRWPGRGRPHTHRRFAISGSSGGTRNTSRGHNRDDPQKRREVFVRLLQEAGQEEDIGEGAKQPRKRRRLSLSKLETIADALLNQEEAAENEKPRSQSPSMRGEQE